MRLLIAPKARVTAVVYLDVLHQLLDEIHPGNERGGHSIGVVEKLPWQGRQVLPEDFFSEDAKITTQTGEATPNFGEFLRRELLRDLIAVPDNQGGKEDASDKAQTQHGGANPPSRRLNSSHHEDGHDRRLQRIK